MNKMSSTNQSNKITINHGSGGRQMHEFISSTIMKKLGNGILEKMDDSAVLENKSQNKISMTTDSYVVNPLFFDGGDIGTLCVCGTVNDLVTSGAKPYALSLAFILEEGVTFETLEKVVNSIAQAAKEADILIVTGDTKVVEKGKGDQIYINTCGIGFIEKDVNISTYNAVKDDVVILSGSMGNHEIAMLKARKMIEFEVDIKSDVAPLNHQVASILEQTKDIHVIKDPTRGGVGSALKEICDHSNCQIEIDEDLLPIDKEVTSVCDLIGYDPLYLANEGKFIIICPQDAAQVVLNSFGDDAKIIGKVVDNVKPNLMLKTLSGGTRRVGMLETTQLPRIC